MVEARPFLPVRIAVLTVSDTRGPAEDRSGDTLVERLQAAGHLLAARAICRDDEAAIAAQLAAWIAEVPILPNETRVKSVAKAVISFS